MITFKQKGDFKNTERLFNNVQKTDIRRILELYANEGVQALASATPVDSGLTASSWGYEIKISENSSSIIWTNSNIQDGVSIAIILQYGHATGTGGYVAGHDYINPAIKPIFDRISDNVWREVSKK